MAKLVSLTDDFEDNTTDAELWTDTGTVAESNGRTVITPTGERRSVQTYDFAASELAAKLPVTTADTGAIPRARTVMRVYLDDGNWLGMVKHGPNLMWETAISGGGLAEVIAPYSATDHLWWRLREAEGTIYWETSPDGWNWTVGNTRSTTGMFALTALRASFTAAPGVEAAPGTAEIETVNLRAVQDPAGNPLASFTDAAVTNDTASQAVQDPAGNLLASFTDAAVTNDTPAPSEAVQDPAGNLMASFTDAPVTNDTVGGLAAQLTGAGALAASPGVVVGVSADLSGGSRLGGQGGGLGWDDPVDWDDPADWDAAHAGVVVSVALGAQVTLKATGTLGGPLGRGVDWDDPADWDQPSGWDSTDIRGPELTVIPSDITVHQLSAALVGSGALQRPGPTVGGSITATLDGSSVFGAPAQTLGAVSATQTGSSALTAAPTAAVQVSAQLAGSGTATMAPRTVQPLSANLSGDGAIRAITGETAQLAADLSGSGALGGGPRVSVPVGAALVGTGSVDATAGVPAGPGLVHITAALAGSGSTTTTATSIPTVVADLSGAGGVGAGARVVGGVGAELAGSAGLGLTPRMAGRLQAALAGTSGATAAVRGRVVVTTALAAHGAFSGVPAVTQQARAARAATGSLFVLVTLRQVVTPTATLSGTGTLSAAIRGNEGTVVVDDEDAFVLVSDDLARVLVSDGLPSTP